MYFKEWIERLEKGKIEVPYTIIFFLKKEIEIGPEKSSCETLNKTMSDIRVCNAIEQMIKDEIIYDGVSADFVDVLNPYSKGEPTLSDVSLFAQYQVMSSNIPKHLDFAIAPVIHDDDAFSRCGLVIANAPSGFVPSGDLLRQVKNERVISLDVLKRVMYSAAMKYYYFMCCKLLEERGGTCPVLYEDTVHKGIAYYKEMIEFFQLDYNMETLCPSMMNRTIAIDESSDHLEIDYYLKKNDIPGRRSKTVYCDEFVDLVYNGLKDVRLSDNAGKIAWLNVENS